MNAPIRIAIALAAAVATAVAPIAVRPALAGPRDEARAHYAAGRAKFDAGDYRGAIAEFAKAQALAPSPILEFNIGLCHERLGETDEALRRYRIYLQQMPDAPNAERVRDKIRRLEAQRGAAPPAAPQPAAPAPQPAAPAPQPATGDPEMDRVASIDIAAVRDRYRGGAAAGPAAPSRAAPAPPPAPGDDAPAAKPVYKKVWFWVVVGVAAVILINVATSDSSGGSAGASTSTALSCCGATILRF